MRYYLPPFIIAVLLLLVPVTARAEDYPKSFCPGPNMAGAGECYEWQEGDVNTLINTITSYQWRTDLTGKLSSNLIGCSKTYKGDPAPAHTFEPGSCTQVHGTIEYRMWGRHHKFNPKVPYMIANFNMFIEKGTSVQTWIGQGSIQYNQSQNRPDCDKYVEWNDNAGGKILKPGVADDPLLAECITGNSEKNTDQNTEDTPSVDEDAKPASIEKGSCDQVKIKKKKIKVTRDGVTCKIARNTVAGFVKTGKTPKGWICVSIKVVKLVNAKCLSLPTVGRAKAKQAVVVGKYRL